MISRLLKYFQAMRLFAAYAGQSPRPVWTNEDAAALGRFLQSPAGCKLRLHLVAEIASANERAALEGTPTACGWARGYKALWAMFQTLSHVAADSDTTEEAFPGAGAGFESYRP